MKNIFLLLTLSLFSFSVFAQSDLSGKWNTGEQHTIIKIEQHDGVSTGTIISSDNPNAKIGNVMVKELKQKKSSWKGKVYSQKRKEWYNAEFSPNGNTLNVVISVGFFSKTLEWTKIKV